MLSSLFGKSKPAASSDATAAPTATATSPSASTATATASPSSAAPTVSSSGAPAQTRTPADPSRALKQLGLFFAGATFLALSTAVTRRSVVRKQRAAQLKFYSPSGASWMGGAAAGEGSAAAAAAETTQETAPHGSFMALEALNLATLNVLSFFVMLTGGVSWALDLSSVDDLRALARRYTRGPGLDGSDGGGGGMTDEEAEREVEAWVAKILKRDEKK